MSCNIYRSKKQSIFIGYVIKSKKLSETKSSSQVLDRNSDLTIKFFSSRDSMIFFLIKVICAKWSVVKVNLDSCLQIPNRSYLESGSK